MGKLSLTVLILATAVHGRGQGCDLRLLSYSLDNRTYNLEIFSSCYLSTYPYVIAERADDGQVIGIGPLESFGQIENTIDMYTVSIDSGFSTDIDDIRFTMTHSSDHGLETIRVDTIVPERLLRLVDVETHASLPIRTYTFDKGVTKVSVRAFCPQMYTRIAMANSEPVSRIVLQEDASCREEQLLWIEGFSSDGVRLVFRDTVGP